MNAFVKIRKITNHGGLRSFQFRLLHKAIVTNVSLHNWKIVNNNKCSFCLEKAETQIHLFVECDKVQMLYEFTTWYAKNECNCNDKLKLSTENIIFSTVHEKVNHIGNFLVTVVKNYTYVTRCLNKKMSTSGLLYEFERARQCEYYNAKAKGKLKTHAKKWKNSMPEYVDLAQEYLDNRV